MWQLQQLLRAVQVAHPQIQPAFEVTIRKHRDEKLCHLSSFTALSKDISMYLTPMYSMLRSAGADVTHLGV